MNPQSTPDSTLSSGISSTVLPVDFDMLMRRTLLENMREGMVCVDRNLRITGWNNAVENMTGLNSTAMIGKPVSPSIFKMQDKNIGEICNTNCPFLACLTSGDSFQKTLIIAGRSGRESEIEFSFHPIRNSAGMILGAMGLLHDTSAQLELQRQLNELYMKAVLDPLTQVANRAEFERLLEEYVHSHRDADIKCSIIICDIDFFKGINDNYGHHIGDQALISFAQLLKQFVRKNDFIARFGGEEFVILCAKCDEDAAVQRAEDIRIRLEKTPQSMLDGKCITASFGVSQLEEGDDPTSLFVRADHALLRAKELGRNRVVRANTSSIASDEIGSGADQSITGIKWRKLKGEALIALEFQMNTPQEVLAEKIRCMIPEIGGSIRSTSEDHVSIFCEVEDRANPGQNSAFIVELDLKKSASGQRSGEKAETYLRLVIQPGRNGWFHRNNNSLADTLLCKLRQYLGITDESSVVKLNRAVNSSGRD